MCRSVWVSPYSQQPHRSFYIFNITISFWKKILEINTSAFNFIYIEHIMKIRSRTIKTILAENNTLYLESSSAVQTHSIYCIFYILEVISHRQNWNQMTKNTINQFVSTMKYAVIKLLTTEYKTNHDMGQDFIQN